MISRPTRLPSPAIVNVPPAVCPSWGKRLFCRGAEQGICAYNHLMADSGQQLLQLVELSLLLTDEQKTDLLARLPTFTETQLQGCIALFDKEEPAVLGRILRHSLETASEEQDLTFIDQLGEFVGMAQTELLTAQVTMETAERTTAEDLLLPNSDG